eukprot:g22530.t1
MAAPGACAARRPRPFEGISDSSSRLSLKKAMEQFGEVVGCHMGARGVDNPIVRYKTQDDLTDDLCMLEAFGTPLDALKKGEVWLDGMILKGEWKNSGRPPPPEGKSGGKGGGRSEGGLDLTSRDIFTSQRSRSRRRRSRSRRRRIGNLEDAQSLALAQSQSPAPVSAGAAGTDDDESAGEFAPGLQGIA